MINYINNDVISPEKFIHDIKFEEKTKLKFLAYFSEKVQLRTQLNFSPQGASFKYLYDYIRYEICFYLQQIK